MVDINYFPGYDKLPGWQSMLLNFLKESAKAGRKRRIEFAQNGIAVPADRAGPAA